VFFLAGAFQKAKGRASPLEPCLSFLPSGETASLPRFREPINLSHVLTAAVRGVDGIAIEVEVRVSSQLPRVDIVGLPEAAVRESAARVRAAINATGLRFPERRVTVNLAPAGVPKSGAGLDLPIAIGILAASGALEPESLAGIALFGELALDGRIRPVRGALARVIAARHNGCKTAIVPTKDGSEAALAPRIDVHVADTLGAVVAHLLGSSRLPQARALPHRPTPDGAGCLSEIRGQDHAKRALEIAAAGGHGLLLCGPPGSGKTMLARRLPSLLPPMSFEHALESTLVRSVSNQNWEDKSLCMERPFRAPHHSATRSGLLGGGNPPVPGEVSLAHRGVLFLDELAEFERRTLESLRQVLEERRVTVTRARYSCVFPAHFHFIAASNPCPCGWFRSGARDCRCDEGIIARYQRKLSGPLLDRIDAHVTVSPVTWAQLDESPQGLTSHDARQRIHAAQTKQGDRGVPSNSEIPDACLDELVDATPDARLLLGRAVDRFQLSARAARRVLRMARTIADLDGQERVGPAGIAEGLGYRNEMTPRSSP
jgi:magnesium chelatase family protein